MLKAFGVGRVNCPNRRALADSRVVVQAGCVTFCGPYEVREDDERNDDKSQQENDQSNEFHTLSPTR